MSSRFPAIGRGPLVACLMAVLIGSGVAGCGRRGPLEAPTDPAAAVGKASGTSSGRAAGGARRSPSATAPASLATQPQSATLDTPDDEAVDEDPDKAISPLPTPATPNTRKRGRGFTIPKDPFILDPIL